MEHFLDISSDALWYWLTFTFCICVLLAFSYQRFDELLPKPTPPAFVSQLFPNATASAITGRSALLRGFVLYFSVSCIIYIALCLCQPLFRLAMAGLTHAAGQSGATSADAASGTVAAAATNKALSDPTSWGTPAGPLMVVALLVGLFPNVAGVREAEYLLRRIGHKVAGIPNDISDRMDRVRDLSQFNLDLLWKDDADDLAQLMRIARMTDLDANGSSLEADYTKVVLLGPWLHGKSARLIWSERVRSRFSEALERVDNRYKSTLDATRDLLLDWTSLQTRNPMVDDAGRPVGRAILPQDHAGSPSRDDDIRTSRDEAATIRSRLERISADYTDLSNKYDAIIAVLVAVDVAPNADHAPPYLARIIRSFSSPGLGIVINPIVIATFFAFIFSFASLFVLKVLKSLFRHEAAGNGGIIKLVDTAIELARRDSLNLVLLFSIPALVASAIRYWRVTERDHPDRWVSMYRPVNGFPAVQILYLVFVTFIVAAALQLLYFSYVIMFPYLTGQQAASDLLRSIQEFMSFGVLPTLMISLVGCLAAALICYVWDRAASQNHTRRTDDIIVSIVLSVAVVVVFAFIQWGAAPKGYFDEDSTGTYYLGRMDNYVKDLVSFAVFATTFITTVIMVIRNNAPPPALIGGRPG